MDASHVGSQPRITDLLRRWSAGDRLAFDEAVTLAYEDLYRIARRKMANERRGHTLQPTALVNEAIAEMMRWEGFTFSDRAHFLRAACLAMRRILTDYARRRAQTVHADASLEDGDVEVAGETGASVVSSIALSQVLERLAAEDAVTAEVATLRLFADLTLEQIADISKVSVPTAHRKWVYAKAHIRKELSA